MTRKTQDVAYWTAEAAYCLRTAMDYDLSSFNGDPECFLTYARMQADSANRDGQPDLSDVIYAARVIVRLTSDAQTDRDANTERFKQGAEAIRTLTAERDAAREELANGTKREAGYVACVAEITSMYDAAIAERDRLRGLLDSALAHVNTAEAERDALGETK